MLYTMRLQGNRYCVVKPSGTTVPGGCHSTQEEAQTHMRALQANVHDADDKRSEGRKVEKTVKSHESHIRGSIPREPDYTWKGR